MPKIKPTVPQRTLRFVLTKQSGRRTVLGVAIPILEGMIASRDHTSMFQGLTASEIKAGFDNLSVKYLKSDF